MSTPAISNTLNALMPSASSQNGNAASATDAGSFNQALSQATNRNNLSDSAQGTQNSQNSQSAQSVQSAQNNGDNDQSNGNAANSNSSASSSTTADAAKSTDSDNTTSSGSSKTDKNDKTDAASATATTTPSADLMAYVASLAQNHTAAATTPPATTDTDTTATEATTTIGTTADSSISNALTAAGAKGLAGKKSDFAAALDKANAGTDGSKTTDVADDSKATTVSSTLKADADLAAAAVAKALDIAKSTDTNTSVSNPQTVAAAAATALQHVNDTQDPQSTRLAPQVGSSGWDQALGQKIVWMVQGAQQSATLSLHPPELGPLQVTLSVSNNQATASFVSQQPEVRHALENAMPRLRDMLSDAGIQLGQSNVSAGSPNQQGAFSQNQSGRQSGQSGTTVDATSLINQVPVSASGIGIVDTFA